MRHITIMVLYKLHPTYTEPSFTLLKKEGDASLIIFFCLFFDLFEKSCYLWPRIRLSVTYKVTEVRNTKMRFMLSITYS